MSESFSSVECTLTVAGFVVRSVGDVSYEEELNSPFKMTLDCVLEVGRGKDGVVVNRSLRHREVTLRLERMGQEAAGSEIKGLIANSFYEQQLKDQSNDDKSRMGFSLEVVPAFALLEHHKDKPQAWHNRTHAFVLQQVLEEELGVYGRQLQNKAKPGPTIPLITRSPGESALAFAQRLLYESGINSYFDHEAGATEVLVLSNDNGAFKKPTLPYDERVSLTGSEGANFVTNVRHSTKSGSSSAMFAGFDPVQSPNLNIGQFGMSDSTLPAQAKELRWTAVRHNDGGSPDETYKAGAELFADRSATEQNGFDFDTSILGGFPGRTMPFDSDGAPVDAVVTSMSFERKEGGYMAKTTATPTRSPSGDAINIRAPMERPPKEYQGLTLARIASSGAAVDVDGRLWCKIKFVWDTEGKDEPQTRAPVMQPMAGAYGGTQWIPRKGDVVIVAFLEGSRENPVIIGCQYDAKQSPLHIGPSDTPGHMKSEAKSGAGTQLPSSASWLGWSYSSIAGSRPSSNARTMFAMNVAEGSELFYLNAPRDYRCDVTRNADYWVKGEATEKIDGNLTEDVGAEYKQTVGANATIDVTANYTVNAQQGTFNFKGTGGLVTGGGMTSTAGGKMLFNAPTFYVNSPSIGFSSKPSSGGGMGAASGETSLMLEPRTLLTAPQAVEISSGDSMVETGPQRVTVESRAVELQGGSGASTKLENGKVVVEAPDGIVFRCGDTEISLTSNGIEISGGKLEIRVKGETSVTSDRIKLEGESLTIENEQTKIAAKRLDITD